MTRGRTVQTTSGGAGHASFAAWKFSLRRIARQGSFRTAEACHGTNEQNVSRSGALRKNGIYLEGAAANLMVKFL
jgi:hypothetical protein